MSKKLIIIGAGGHGRVAENLAKLNGYKKIYFLDDNVISTSVIGKVKDFEVFKNSYDFFVGIGDNALREQISLTLKEKGVTPIPLIHPSAVIGDNVQIENGVIVMAGTVINTGAQILEGAIINTSASVDHDSIVGKYTHVAVGAHLCGGIKVGNNCLIGAGAIVVNGKSIPSNTVIGAGGVVNKSITKSGVYVGVPVKELSE